MREFVRRNPHTALLLVFVVIVFIVSLFMKNGVYVIPEFEEDAMTLRVGKEVSWTIEYQYITKVALMPLPEETLTEPYQHIKRSSIAFGGGATETWGPYVLGADMNVPWCVVVYEGPYADGSCGDTVVFNYVNEEGTRSMFDLLLEMLQDQPGGWHGEVCVTDGSGVTTSTIYD